MNTTAISRRRLLKSIALAVASAPLSNLAQLAGPALVKRTVKSPQGTYFTYPHSNAFLPNGACVLGLPTSGPNNPGLDYVAFDFRNGEASRIAHVRDARLYFAVDAKGTLAATRKNSVYILDATGKDSSPPRQVFGDPDWVFHSDCDISADGARLAITRNQQSGAKLHRVDIVDVASGRNETVAEREWLMDHAHFSPFDPEWLVFCCAEPKRYSRLWLWHRREAPQTRRVFNQTLADGKVYDIGHERAMFNKRSMLVVAYGSNSNARPCGLFEVGFDGSVKLVSESNRDFHCNISRDGRWAVVSLQGQHEFLRERISTTWLSEGPGWGTSDIMIVNMVRGTRQFLYRSSNAASGQPYEAQPTISPDGKWVLVKDARDRCVVGLEIDQDKLNNFLN